MKKLFALLVLASAAPALADKVDFVVRYEDEINKRLIAIQGDRSVIGNDGSNGFVFPVTCNEKKNCECLLYRDMKDPAPVKGVNPRRGTDFNAFYCDVPATENPALFHYVKVTENGVDLTGLAPISTKIPLSRYFRKLSPAGVRKIHYYQVERSFFEGEGVGMDSLTCLAGQRLAHLTARYSFFVYKGEGGEELQPGQSYMFPGDICGLTNILKLKADPVEARPRFLLYKEAAGPFVVGITMTRAPEGKAGELATTLYGYAGIPEGNGECMPGLKKAWAWVAAPKDSLPVSQHGAGTSFQNPTKALNDTVVDTAKPPAFQLVRRPSQVPCDMTGSCRGAEFGAAQPVQTLSYTPMLPNICVMPPEMLDP